MAGAGTSSVSALIRHVPAVALAVTLAACGGTTTPAPPVAQLRQLATEHFVFHYPPVNEPSMAAVGRFVEDESRRVASDLAAGAMRIVQVRFYPTHAELAEAVRPIAGPIPSWATGLVTAPDQIHMLAPAASDPVERVGTSVVHEFTHCVSLHLDPASGNNPRWLWESVALYEARQFVDPRTIPYLAAGQVPSLTDLNSMSNTRIYDVGFLLGEFIVERGGTEALRRLILARGDTRQVLGMELSAFESGWREFLQIRYGV